MRSAGWIFLAALAVAGGVAHGHPGHRGGQRIELQAKLRKSRIDFTAFLPVRVLLEDAFDGRTVRDYRSMDKAAVAKTVESYFHKTHPVRVDGIQVRPVFEDIRLFVPPNPGQKKSEVERIRTYGMFAVELRYETKGKPKRVSFVWDRYLDPSEGKPPSPEPADGDPPQGAPSDGTAAEARSDQPDGKKKQPVMLVISTMWKRRAKLVTLTREEPEHIWHGQGAASVPASLETETEPVPATLPLPAASVATLALAMAGFLAMGSRHAVPRRAGAAVGPLGLLAAAGLLTVGWVAVPLPWTKKLTRPADEKAARIFQSLHQNIYRAFDYDQETAIYETLAKSVDGPQLEKIYSNVYDTLLMEEEGGAMAKVEAVRYRETEVLSPDKDSTSEPAAFRVRCRWRVRGRVRHWGHTHRRTNAFEAIYTVAPRKGRWKITGTEILEQKRVNRDPVAER